MAIRKFVAPTTREAMMQVRRELGEDAVILANRRVGNRIEVLAAAPDAVEALVERSESQSAALRERAAPAGRGAPGPREPTRQKVEPFQDFVRRQMHGANEPQEPAQEPARHAPVRGAANQAPRGQAAVSMYHDVAEIEDDTMPAPAAKAASAAPRPAQPRPDSTARGGIQPPAARAGALGERGVPESTVTATVQASHRAPQVETEATRADPAVFRRRPAHVAPTPQLPAAAPVDVDPRAPLARAEAVSARQAAARANPKPAPEVRQGAPAMASISAGSASVPAIAAAARPAAAPKVDIELVADATHVSWMESAQVAIPGIEPKSETTRQAAPHVTQSTEQAPQTLRQPTPQAPHESAVQVSSQPAPQAMPQPAPQPGQAAAPQAMPQSIPTPLAHAIRPAPLAIPQRVPPAAPQAIEASSAAMALMPHAIAQPEASAFPPEMAHPGSAATAVPAVQAAFQAQAPLDAGAVASATGLPAGWAAPVTLSAAPIAVAAPLALPPVRVPAPAQQAGAPAPRASIDLPSYPAQPRAVETQLLAELQSMHSLLREQLATISSHPATAAPQNPAGTRVTTRLLTAGFSVDVARRIAAHMPAATDLAQAEGWLLEVLAHNIKCAAPEEGIVERAGQPATPGQVFALVGPTGVGKTTTVAKLAARFAVKHGTSALGLITLDAYRVAAPEQLRTYGRILGTPVHLAQDSATLRELLATMVHKRLVLIDTCGVSQRDQRLAEMLDLLAAVGVPGRPIQRVLLLNSASHAETLDDAARAWRAHECAGAILTKLDEASRIGGALDVALRHRLALLGLTNGQRVPEDWHGANGRLLAHLALKPAAQLFELADNEGAALAQAALPAHVALGATHA